MADVAERAAVGSEGSGHETQAARSNGASIVAALCLLCQGSKLGVAKPAKHNGFMLRRAPQGMNALV